MLLELLSGGMTADQIINDYPEIEPEDLRAIYAFAARLAAGQSMTRVVV